MRQLLEREKYPPPLARMPVLWTPLRQHPAAILPPLLEREGGVEAKMLTVSPPKNENCSRILTRVKVSMQAGSRLDVTWHDDN